MPPPRQSAPRSVMAYGYCLDGLILVLQRKAPAKAAAFALLHRRGEHGLLSVGLKIHCLSGRDHFASLVEGLGGFYNVLDANSYKLTGASICLVLPPVGNARSAILLLECIEQFVGINLFNNKSIQLQVCSPGRLDTRRSALLAIGFYLGSDTLRRYDLGDLETSFSERSCYCTGRRLVIYDAEGAFDEDFDWWRGFGRIRQIDRHLPFTYGRSDLLAGSASRLDIQNINLLATLLVHSQYNGYWGYLGKQFENDMDALLHRHLLSGLIEAPWVRTPHPNTSDDQKFYSAIQELTAYAFDEATRMHTNKPEGMLHSLRAIAAKCPQGILEEVQLLLTKYRTELVSQSRLLAQGEQA
jgi:hypothetical protein